MTSQGTPVSRHSEGQPRRAVLQPRGVGVSALTLAATSGFLAFAGFESAGSLGEESFAPTRAIPRAIITAVVFGAVFYVACVTAQSVGSAPARVGCRLRFLSGTAW